MNWFWYLLLAPLFGFVAWGFVDGLVLAPRRARRAFAAMGQAVGRPIERVDQYLSRIDMPIDGRTIALRSQYIGSGGNSGIRGERGHLWVTATLLRAPAWEMHDLQVRQRRARETFERRFDVVESGVPVRDGWLDDAVRAAITDLFDSGIAVGTLRVERGALQHVADWGAVVRTDDAAMIKAFLVRLAGVATALERAAGRRHPMA